MNKVQSAIFQVALKLLIIRRTRGVNLTYIRHSKRLLRVLCIKAFFFIANKRFLTFKPFQLSVAFFIETSFYMELNTGLKWVKMSSTARCERCLPLLNNYLIYPIIFRFQFVFQVSCCFVQEFVCRIREKGTSWKLPNAFFK